MRYRGVRHTRIDGLVLPLTIILFLVQFPGCVSSFNGMTPDNTGVGPAPHSVTPGQHPLQADMNVPGYLADSFRYGEADLIAGACRKTAPRTPPHFWRGLLDGSMALPKYDYITGLCLYSVGSEAHYRRAFLMDILGYNDLAILEYTLAIEMNPQNDRYYNNRGSLYLLGDRPYRAVLDFTRAIEISPDRPEAYYNRGRALDKMGKYDEAHRDYEKAVDLGICDKLPSLKICR